MGGAWGGWGVVSFKHGRGLCLGPAQNGGGSTSNRGLLECGFLELEVRPWVRVCGWGLGPAWLEGVSEGLPLSVEAGPWVGV